MFHAKKKNPTPKDHEMSGYRDGYQPTNELITAFIKQSISQNVCKVIE